jgi:hypothetical protein
VDYLPQNPSKQLINLITIIYKTKGNLMKKTLLLALIFAATTTPAVSIANEPQITYTLVGKCKEGISTAECLGVFAGLSKLTCSYETRAYWRSQSIENYKRIHGCATAEIKHINELSKEVFIKYKDKKEATITVKRMLFAFESYMNNLLPNSHENETTYTFRMNDLERDLEKAKFELKLLHD